jgi:hypothetical protein
MNAHAETEFVCDCEKQARLACADEGFFKEYEGKQYCVLHYPQQDKLETFRVALNKKLEAQDFCFRGVWFPEEVDFTGFRFSAKVDFGNTTFSGNADFGGATFSTYANFGSAIFSANASFYGATFCALVNFHGVTFSAKADFTITTFDAKAIFSYATFKDYVHFAGSAENKVLGRQPLLDLQLARIEKPDRCAFHRLQLLPHWFINVDPRKFEFTDVEWNGGLKQALRSLRNTGDNTRHRLLAITYRQLAVNAEENHRYREASRFRYNAFEARRIEKFWGFVPWRLDWWYWLMSGYGESVGRAFIVFIALITLFAFGYTRVSFEQRSKAIEISGAQMQPASPALPTTKGKPLGLVDAVNYSVDVIFLQKPEPKPLTQAAKWLVRLETLLGPAQAALLALAVRRRFMR